jgi:hypothetical protein
MDIWESPSLAEELGLHQASAPDARHLTSPGNLAADRRGGEADDMLPTVAVRPGDEASGVAQFVERRVG